MPESKPCKNQVSNIMCAQRPASGLNLQGRKPVQAKKKEPKLLPVRPFPPYCSSCLSRAFVWLKAEAPVQILSIGTGALIQLRG